jgi:LysM repeat protein
MNNPTPLVPQGIIDPKNKRRARVKIGVFFVLAVHGAGLLALLLQGCHREDTTAAQANQSTNTVTPPFEATPPAIVESSTPITTNVTPPISETNTTPVAVAAATDYVVVSGDTFSTIAKKSHVTIAALRDANANPGVEPTKLQIGKPLHIPAPAVKTTASATPVNPQAEPAHSQQGYTVKSGDTLIKIAQINHTTVRAIRAANNLKNDRITVGQKIKIPVKSTPVASTETASTTTTAGTPVSH